MASFKILGKNGAYLSYFANTDTAILPGILTTDVTQQLTIISGTGAIISGSDLQIAANKGITAVSGTGAFDFSGGSGLFKTSTGVVTIGPGAISISGNATVQNGVTLSTTGTGMINLPSLFQINSVAVSANVTSANLDVLTGGTNADALHTHLSVGATTLNVTSQTVWTTPVSGEVGYISANNTWTRARADAAGTLAALGAYNGTANTLITDGRVNLFFVPGLTLTANDSVYLSAVTAGKVTNVAPTTAGQYEYQIARVLNAASYDNINGSAQTCIWDRKMPILLA